jgi:uncharacterized protein YmfQ (DUF2313 family)
MSWLDVFKHVLPNARAWRITVEKTLRQFFEGLSGTPEAVRTFFDDIFDDIDPQKTRQLDEWEQQFALPDTGMADQARRDRLDATWKALGGQDPRYIEDTLQGAGFDVYVHEWWVPSVAHPAGGSVNGDEVPVARDPFTYLWDGAAPRQFVGCGHDLAYCGGDDMFSNSNDAPSGYPLVNKIVVAGTDIGCGHDLAYCGGDQMAAGAGELTYRRKQYIIPADPTKYPYFLYIGGAAFPDSATIPSARRDEFEDLCLKICPTEQWLGVLANYS